MITLVEVFPEVWVVCYGELRAVCDVDEACQLIDSICMFDPNVRAQFVGKEGAA